MVSPQLSLGLFNPKAAFEHHSSLETFSKPSESQQQQHRLPDNIANTSHAIKVSIQETALKKTVPRSSSSSRYHPHWRYVSFFILRFCLSIFSVARSTEVVMESRASSCLSSSASVSKARPFSFFSICRKKRLRAFSDRPVGSLRNVIDPWQLVIS